MRISFKYKHILILIFALFLVLLSGAKNVFAISDISMVKPEKNVLVIHQYSAEQAYVNLFNQGLRDVLAQDDRYYYNISYEYLEIDKMPHDVIYLDMKIDQLVYKQKHSNWIPDVVVTSCGVSDWLLKYKKELFDETPIVACSPSYSGKSIIPIDHFTDHYLLPGNDSFANNYQLILDLLPDTKNIYVVLGNSYEEQNLLSIAQDEAKAFEDRVNFIYTNRRSYDDMLSTLRNAPNDSAVLFSRWLTDVEGESFDSGRCLRFISETIPIPVFGTQRQSLGNGIIGGYLYNISLFGADAGNMAIKLLDGFEPTVYKDEKRYHRYVFDDRALKQWNVNSNRLPENSEILFAEKNFWQEYGDILFIGSIIIFLETALIIGLIYNNRGRIKAEAELVNLNESLEAIVEKRTLQLQEVNAELEELNRTLDLTARIDALTGLYNRRHMEERLNEAIQVFKRQGQIFSVMLIDIDDFKLINDTYGHKAGDFVLRDLSKTLRKSVREYDVVSRRGGEEFLLLFPGLFEEDAMVRAEMLRTKIQNSVWNYEGVDLSVTITIGVATIRENETASQLINRADTALYQGKNSGKNKSILAE